MPLSISRLGNKRINLNDNFSLEMDSQQSKHTCLTLQHATASQFLSAVYNGKWYIGKIKVADFSNIDFLLDFMIPNGPLSFFQWSKKHDICWVSFQHVLYVIKALCSVSSRGQHQMTAAPARIIENAWLNHKC